MWWSMVTIKQEYILFHASYEPHYLPPDLSTLCKSIINFSNIVPELEENLKVFLSKCGLS